MTPDAARPPLGPWRAGNTGTEGVWQFHANAEGPAVMVTALVHGNEPCGAFALCAALEAGVRPKRGRLTLAFCNLEASDRYDPARPDEARFVDEDLNRVWGPALAGAPTSHERQRARALQPFVETADWLLDLHSMHEPGPPVMLTGLGPRMLDVAMQLGAPAMIVRDAGHAEGARMRDHGRFRAPAAGDRHGALLLECGAHSDPESRRVALDALARFLTWTGCVDATDLPAGWISEPAAPPRLLEVVDAVVAQGWRFRFSQPWRHGQYLPHGGTLIGWNDDEPVVTGFDDCTLVMPSLRQLRPGVTVVRLARTIAALPTP